MAAVRAKLPSVEPGKYTTRFASPCSAAAGNPNASVKSAHTGCTASEGKSFRRRRVVAIRCSREMSTGTYVRGARSASSSRRVLRLAPLPGSISTTRGPSAAAIPGASARMMPSSVRVR
jgi:hypothetical protein